MKHQDFFIFCFFICLWGRETDIQQFSLAIRLMGALQRADRFCCDEFIALAMDEELQKRDASVMQPATDSQRELLTDII